MERVARILEKGNRGRAGDRGPIDRRDVDCRRGRGRGVQSAVRRTAAVLHREREGRVGRAGTIGRRREDDLALRNIAGGNRLAGGDRESVVGNRAGTGKRFEDDGLERGRRRVVRIRIREVRRLERVARILEKRNCRRSSDRSVIDGYDGNRHRRRRAGEIGAIGPCVGERVSPVIAVGRDVADRILAGDRDRAMRRLRSDRQHQLNGRGLQIVAVQRDGHRLSGDCTRGLGRGYRRLRDRGDVDRQRRLRLRELGVGRRIGDGVGADIAGVRNVGEGSRRRIEVLDRAVLRRGDDGEGDRIVFGVGRLQRDGKRNIAGCRQRRIGDDRRQVGGTVDGKGGDKGAAGVLLLSPSSALPELSSNPLDGLTVSR